MNFREYIYKLYICLKKCTTYSGKNYATIFSQDKLTKVDG